MKRAMGSDGIERDRSNQPATPATRRRIAVLAGHLGDLGAARELWNDEHPEVRAAALGALARLGAVRAHLAAACRDPSPLVRRRAAELVASCSGSDRAVALLVPLLDDAPLVAETAAWALGERARDARPVHRAEAVEALARAALDAPDLRVREAAVAALGAIGSAEGLDAVLAALEGPVALRRRAVVALAGFRDPRADEALKRCATDRDWQVRQAAEEIVGLAGR
jgi:HEAT repeat protein